MAITYNWTIQAMDCVPQEDGHTDVVVVAHWNVSASDGTYTSSVYGTQSFTYNPESSFTPYEDLTQEQVVGWVQEAMGEEQVASLEANLDQQIANQINPPIVTPPLPWAPAPVTAE
jgi:hypothetical protein